MSCLGLLMAVRQLPWMRLEPVPVRGTDVHCWASRQLCIMGVLLTGWRVVGSRNSSTENASTFCDPIRGFADVHLCY